MGEIMMFICSDRESSDEWELGRGQHQMVTAAVGEMLTIVMKMIILITIAMRRILIKLQWG